MSLVRLFLSKSSLQQLQTFARTCTGFVFRGAGNTRIDRTCRIFTGTVTFALLLSCAGWSQVSISSPASGSTVASPIHVSASAKSSHPITAMRIYLDNSSVYLAYASQINTYVSAGSGNHTLVVQAWDSSGAVLNRTAYVSVTSGSATGTTTVFKQIQQWTGWQTCGSCGNDGATGPQATYSMIRGIGYPSLSGSSAEFKISGRYPYTDGYWWYAHQALSTGLKYLRYEFDLYIPSGLENAPEAIEFECQQQLNGHIYNFAWQAMYSGNVWRVFNYSTKKWENSGIPLHRFSPGTWHHIAAEFHDDPSTHKTYHDALIIDGVRHALNIVHWATPASVPNQLTNAVQLDLNGVPTPYHVFVDNMKITFTH